MSDDETWVPRTRPGSALEVHTRAIPERLRRSVAEALRRAEERTLWRRVVAWVRRRLGRGKR